ncbi:hypothetical protein FPSE5266_05406 [Fusarium pseudograminearum]|nr:hypothetical protein FPSE5266_05406 [Fusarium pseudograminearum]
MASIPQLADISRLNVNQQIKHQDRIFVAFIPFEDRQYCYECFTTLSNFLDSLIHLHEDYVSKKSGVPIKLEKSDPESSSDAVQSHDEASASFDHNDYWDECFKNLDTFFGTDIFREGNLYHHIDSEHQARTMFEALAKKKHDLPVRLRALAESMSFCAVCNMSFESQEATKDHNAASHQDQLGTPESVLQQEPASTNVEIPVKEEQESTASEASWYCTYCDITFSSQEEIDKHNVDHSNCVRFVLRRANETHTCIACNRTFNTQDEAHGHLSSTHMEIIRHWGHFRPESGWYCAVCRQIYESQQKLEFHFREIHPKILPDFKAPPEGSWYCSVCEEIFENDLGIDDHNMRKHGGQRPFLTGRARRHFTCITCSRRFNAQHELDDHTSDGQHMQLPPEVDTSSLNTGDALKIINQETTPCIMPESVDKPEPYPAVVAENTPETAFFCLGCNLSFKTEPAFKHHNTAMHNGTVQLFCNYPYPCVACNRAFKSQADIDKHNMWKHGPPPASPTSPVILQVSVVDAYSCPFCTNMISKREEPVDRHIAKKHDASKIANVVSAFACTVCGDIFSTKVNVARHGVSKHGVSSFILKTLETATLEDRHSDSLTCHTCDKVFASRSGLQDHNRNSHNPMTCRCNETFPGLSSFRTHEKSCRWWPTPTPETMPPQQYSFTSVYQGPGLLPYDYSLDRSEYDLTEDSELDSEDDSECESEGESEGVSECDSDVDTEDNSEEDVDDDDSESDEDYRNAIWLEYGEIGRVPCLLGEYGCNDVFRSGSLLVYHYEHENCCVDGLNITSEILDETEEKFANLLHNKYDIYKCPYCKNTGGGRFRYLHDLVKHAETNACRLRVASPREIKQEPEQPSETVVYTQAPVLQYTTGYDIKPEPQTEPMTPPAEYGHPVDVNGRLITPPPWAFNNDHCKNEPGYSDDSSDLGSDQNSDSDEDQNSEEEEEEDDEDDDEKNIWPEYGERRGGMTCPAEYLGCLQIFHKASGMLHHVETAHQHDFLWKSPDEMFNSTGQCEQGRRLYSHETKHYYCPNCSDTDQGMFESLSLLLKHAESNICDLKVRSGPVGELYDAVDVYADNKYQAWDGVQSVGYALTKRGTR